VDALRKGFDGPFQHFYGLFDFSKLMGIVQFNNGLGFLFQTIGGSFSQLQGSLAGANRVFEMIDAQKEAPEGDAFEPVAGKPAIALREVQFSYEDGQEVLTSLTENVYPGEKVALVGGSGSGKSTALKLLLGFYGIRSGSVELFGNNVGEYPTALRRLVAYVPQTCYLFSGTVRDNIAAGRPGATKEEIEQAARAALAHDFILELPQGYDTEVGERGAQLSGGQRQRIAIARAVLKNAPILLLDEATASLDSQSEAHVQQALDSLMEGRTVVVVAHRLSTIRHADRILVLDGGSIVERGTHEELVSQDSRYAAYCRLQFEGMAS
jgi:ATP-binding cassette subfamily B protein